MRIQGTDSERKDSSYRIKIRGKLKKEAVVANEVKVRYCFTKLWCLTICIIRITCANNVLGALVSILFFLWVIHPYLKYCHIFKTHTHT